MNLKILDFSLRLKTHTCITIIVHQQFAGDNSPLDNSPLDNSPPGNSPLRQFSTPQFSTPQFSTPQFASAMTIHHWQFTIGQLSAGQLSAGQLSAGQFSIEQISGANLSLLEECSSMLNSRCEWSTSFVQMTKMDNLLTENPLIS